MTPVISSSSSQSSVIDRHIPHLPREVRFSSVTMPRTLATARGRCPQKAALKEQGINPNKLLSSSRVTPRRVTAESKPPCPRCRQTTEKIFQFALGEVHASDKSLHTEYVSQLPKEEKAEAHREVKQEVVDRKRTAEEEIPTRTTMKKKIVKREGKC